MDVGRELRRARQERGLTLVAASMRLHLDPSSLSQMERGRRSIPPEVLARAAKLYGRPDLWDRWQRHVFLAA